MLKDDSKIKLSLSPYQSLYDIIIPEDHFLRKEKKKSRKERTKEKNKIKR